MAKQIGEFTPGFGCGKFGCNFFPGVRPSPESVVSNLLTGTSAAIFGILNIGKSSLLAETRNRLRALGKNVIWINLDIYDTPAKALTEILSSMQHGGNKEIIAGILDWAEKSEMIPTELKTTVGALISGVFDSSSESFDEKYVDVLFRKIGQLLEAQKSEDKPIIIFDELTTLIKNTIDNNKSEGTRSVVGRLNSFLGQLRYWRTDEVGIRMAVSGSVSFNWLKREYGIRSDSINDCVRIDIEELDRDEARKLLEMCVNVKTPPNWNEKLTEDLLDLMPAFYPGVIQLTYSVVNTESNPVSVLDDAMHRKIYRALRIHYFEQFTSRFHRYSTLERSRVNKLLDELESKEGEKIKTRDALNILNGSNLAEDEVDGQELIEQLMADSFIDIVPGGICLSSGLVPAWRNTPN